MLLAGLGGGLEPESSFEVIDSPLLPDPAVTGCPRAFTRSVRGRWRIAAARSDDLATLDTWAKTESTDSAPIVGQSQDREAQSSSGSDSTPCFLCDIRYQANYLSTAALWPQRIEKVHLA